MNINIFSRPTKTYSERVTHRLFILYFIIFQFLYYIIFFYYGKGFSYFARVWIMAMTIVYLGKMRIKDSYFFKFRIICMHFKDKY